MDIRKMITKYALHDAELLIYALLISLSRCGGISLDIDDIALKAGITTAQAQEAILSLYDKNALSLVTEGEKVYIRIVHEQQQ